MGWQWHQLDHMQIICILFQTDNHASTSSLNFLQAGCSSWRPANSVKGLKVIKRTEISQRNPSSPFCSQRQLMSRENLRSSSNIPRCGHCSEFPQSVASVGLGERKDVWPVENRQHLPPKVFFQNKWTKKINEIRASELEFNVPFHHKHGYIRDENQQGKWLSQDNVENGS